MTLLNLASIAVPTTAAAVLAGAYMRERAAQRRLRQELADMQQELLRNKAALAEQKQLDSIKDEFISNVSHELRTPLTSIRGALGLLSAGVMGAMDAKASNLLRIASNNTDRLARLINDILDLERMDSGRATMQLRACSLRELIAQSVETMTTMANEADVRVDVVPEPGGMPTAFEGDPDRIQQVLVNLLSNAIKFSPRGSSILITSSFDNDSLNFRVEDAGRGVPVDKLESIFGRFNQVETSDARQKGGTGLGLAICRTILAQHNGSIVARRNDQENEGRIGTTFLVQLPRSAAAEAAMEPHANAAIGPVLVCDDDSELRHMVAEQLRRHGFVAIESSGGEQTLEIAAREPVEAILLDLSMTGVSGWETIERLKSDERTAKIPVVVLSVLEQREKNDAGTPSKADGWVQKPFGEKRLLAELGRVLHPGSDPSRVLLVEDDTDLAAIVISSFEQDTEADSMRVLHARSLADAQSACRAMPPDLIILDLKLSDGSGFALVDWLRGQRDLRALPLIVYSGLDVSAEEKIQLRLGPTEFLDKARVSPQEVEQLVLAMMRHLRTAAA
ncbi:MAG: response regulator [Acidobacteriaceae bacterium]|nr:response regulator [Acidobacteriaceae bacterium]